MRFFRRSLEKRMQDKILLIDGHSMLNRAFYGVPPLTNGEGLNTNAVYGFLNIMFKIIEEEQPVYMAVAFDVKAPTFRHEIFKEYKGTRKPAKPEFVEQVPVIKDVLKAMNIVTLEKAGLEADDILGTVSKAAEKAGMKVTVLSGDRDLLQLATDEIMIRIPKTSKGTTEVFNYNTKDVIEQYGLTPAQIIELKGLMGDSSDNIPGLQGVGEKTATSILQTYGDIENAYIHREELKPKVRQRMEEDIEIARLSKVLATINIEADIDFDFESMKVTNFYTEEAYKWFKRLEFKNLLNRFDENAGKNAAEEAADFTLITTKDELEKLISRQPSNIGLYTFGTPDKKWNHGDEEFGSFSDNELYGASVAFSEDEVFVIVAEGGLTPTEVFEAVNHLIETSTEVSFASLKQTLKHINLKPSEKFFDVSIAGYLLNPVRDNYYYDDLAGEYLGMILSSQKERLGKLTLKKAYEEAREDFLYVTGYSALVALQSTEPLTKALENDGMYKLFTDLEMPLIFTLDSMEKLGIKALKNELEEYGAKLYDRIIELEKKIYETAGEEFNINSPKQLGEILFEKMGLKGGKKTKTGYSTAADVLEKLAPDNPIVSDVLEYRQLTKLKSTYADGLTEYIEEDGRIHSNFNQTITATGRISSTEPNLQNIPVRMELGRLIRKVFVPEDGYIFVDADYSQIELRVLAHMSGDENLIKAYNEEADIHAITASQVFHVPLNEVTSTMRSNAKAVNFGIVYGISSFGLSQGLSITRAEAKEYIEKYYETYPGIKNCLDGMIESAKQTGNSVTLLGRKRPIKELSSSNFMQRSFGERVAMNAPIQGTAADIIKVAMIDVDKELKNRGLKSRLILQVHDELLIETKIEEKEEVLQILKEKMMGAASLKVPLEIQISEGTNWYEAK